MKRYKIVNQQRFYLFVTFVLIMVFAFIFLFVNSKGAHSVVLHEEYKEVQVMEGDTLWDIAIRNMPDGYDVRYLVYKLREFNNLETAYIYPGDAIKVPILK